ncbi:MAG: ABC transporter permease [Sphaerobacteraceae bacterium]|nr:MAG: ABC transporter permease [Sphaerobacteraceae bacterium]
MSETSEDRPVQRSQTESGSSELARLQTNQRSEFRRALNRFMRYRAGLVGLGFIVILTILAIFPMVFAPENPTEIFPGMRGASPSSDFWLGNDHVGRDVLSRTIWGAQTALLVGVLATTITAVLGVAIGAIAGYFGGWTDSILSRLIDTVMAVPLLAILLVLAAVLGPSLRNVILIIGALVWTQFARVVRADMMSLRERDYVLAARAIGAKAPRLIMRHMLPNILGPVIVMFTLGIGSIIILEAALSFLGLGVQPPTPSWGRSLSDARPHIMRFPHMAIVPGVMITLTVLAFNLIGDGLRDALDPRQRE